MFLEVQQVTSPSLPCIPIVTIFHNLNFLIHVSTSSPPPPNPSCPRSSDIFGGVEFSRNTVIFFFYPSTKTIKKITSSHHCFLPLCSLCCYISCGFLAMEKKRNRYFCFKIIIQNCVLFITFERTQK